MSATPFNLFSLTPFLAFLKATTLLLLILYAFFALIIVRQVGLMSKTLITGVSPLVKLLTFVHLLVAIGLIVLAWKVL